MVAIPHLLEFGKLLAKAPAELSLNETAQALRIPVTTIGDWLRAGTRSQALPPAQARVLSQLSAGDSLTVSALAQAQDIATSSMTESVGRLVDAKLVVKTAAVDDRREVRVSITQHGRRRLAQSLEERTAMLEARLAGLTDEEREKVAAALPALWKLAELNADIWPRVPVRPRRPRRTAVSPN